ncbi:class F sortase [Halobacillus campisalis]|uniref:Class F sortase n=1 Tax=Halobacillus campisalis TaxID=435909 RepID=A0ABW2K0H6_9BACI|nr:class F sortase [Halobacillus campisalis]
MKPFLASIALGLLVFFISHQLLQDEPSEGARVLSSEESSKIEAEKNEPVVDNIETTNIEPHINNQPAQGVVPASLEIPSINVSASITPEGLTNSGGMEVPDNDVDVGWFEPGTKPGNKGNAVLAGHVDSYQGPAVFFELDELKAGDEVILTGTDGSVLTFTVREVIAYPRNEAPIETIFGSSDSRSLNLITCTGLFDSEAQTHQDRLVVYTELTDHKGA